MALTLRDLQGILTPPTPVGTGARVAIEGFDSLGRAGSRHRQAELQESGQQLQREQLGEAQRSAMERERQARAQLKFDLVKQRQAQMIKRAEALERFVPQLRDRMTRDEALRQLEAFGWQVVRPAPVPAPVPLQMGGGDLMPPDGAAPPDARPRRPAFILQAGGLELPFDPDADVETSQLRLAAALEQLAENAGPTEGPAYEQIKGAAGAYGQLYGFDPAKAQEQLIDIMSKRLNREAQVQAAGLAAKKFEAGQEKRGWDKMRQAAAVAKVGETNDAMDNFREAREALSAADAAQLPDLIAGIKTKLARAYGEDRVTDNDVKRVSGDEDRALVENLLNMATRLTVGGRHEKAMQHTLRAIEVMEGAYNRAATMKFRRLSKLVQAMAPEERGEAIQFLIPQFSQYDWFDAAKEKYLGGSPARAGSAPRVSPTKSVPDNPATPDGPRHSLPLVPGATVR